MCDISLCCCISFIGLKVQYLYDVKDVDPSHGGDGNGGGCGGGGGGGGGGNGGGGDDVDDDVILGSE
jgi:hypothetical protein